MRKIVGVSLVLLLCASSAAMADEGNTESRKVGDGITGFFKKLNPIPFFQEQERQYNERKAGMAK